MIQLYMMLVKAGKRTCDLQNKEVPAVPENLQQKVKDALRKQGYDENGNRID